MSMRLREIFDRKRRLRQRVERLVFHDEGCSEFTLNGLSRKLRIRPTWPNPARARLAIVLNDMVKEGLLVSCIRVEDDSTGSILGEYADILDIPRFVQDSKGESVWVRVDMLSCVYRIAG